MIIVSFILAILSGVLGFFFLISTGATVAKVAFVFFLVIFLASLFSTPQAGDRTDIG